MGVLMKNGKPVLGDGVPINIIDKATFTANKANLKPGAFYAITDDNDGAAAKDITFDDSVAQIKDSSGNDVDNVQDALEAASVKLAKLNSIADGDANNGEVTAKLSKLDKIDTTTTATSGQALAWDINSSTYKPTTIQSGGSASTTTYTNTTSGLSATNVQDAIDEVCENSSIVTDTLLANTNQVEITSTHFTDNSALYVPLFEPTELNADGTYKVLTCVHEIVDTTNGKITITTAETPSVNTRVAIQITKF